MVDGDEVTSLPCFTPFVLLPPFHFRFTLLLLRFAFASLHFGLTYRHSLNHHGGNSLRENCPNLPHHLLNGPLDRILGYTATAPLVLYYKSSPQIPPPVTSKARFFPWDTTDRCRKTGNSAGHQTSLFALGRALLHKLKKEGIRDRDVLAWCEVESGDKNFVETAAEG